MSQELIFTCPLPNGLHARPASLISDAANNFGSEFALTNRRSGAIANAKSVLSIVGADVKLGDACQLKVSGADEQTAFAAMREFIERMLPGCDEALSAPLTEARNITLPRTLQNAGVKWHPGIAVSGGIGQGRVVLIGGVSLPPELRNEPAETPSREHEKLERALTTVRVRIEAGAAQSSILKAHLAILRDVALTDKLAERIAQGRSAGQAVVDASEFFAAQLRSAGSLYIRERAIDIEDICFQLLEAIYGARFQPAIVELAGPSIVAADSLAPRQLLSLDRKWLKGLVLASAGTTSHAVILARSLAVPTLAGVRDAQLILSPGQGIVVDANRGFLITEWTAPVQRFYKRERETSRKREAALARFGHAPAVTVEGRTIEVAANVSSAEELAPAFEKGADGIGVFRTEMLFADRDSAPSEEEQFEIYAAAASAASGRAVIVRTIDIGGDKPLPYLNLPRETNPFLGYRGVRIYPAHPDLLNAQLRAIVRASALGRIEIMVPMISSVTEVRWFKARVASVQEELKAEGVAFNPSMPVGIMVEVPSVAFLIDQLCPEVDFFSIGTNDLAQYFLAVDRDNATVAGLSSVRHPGFLRLLKMIVDGAHKGGKWAGMCGEMAGDVRQLKLLVGLGLDELSGSASAIPAIKAGIARLSTADCQRLLEQAMACGEVSEVDQLLESQLPILDRDLVLFESGSESKEEAIQEIVDAFHFAGRTADPRKVEDAVWAREAVYSTGLGYGFAIPHCKTDAVNANSIGILKLKQPVEWGSMDGKPVQVVILLAMRESGSTGSHMKVFSRLARKLMHEEFRESLLNAPGAEDLLARLSVVTSDPA